MGKGTFNISELEKEFDFKNAKNMEKSIFKNNKFNNI